MSLRFSVLASGSSGNASLLQAGAFGVLLDFGLGPRSLGQRLEAVGASWHHVHAAILTHLHSDHWRERSLARLHRLGAPLYCHAEHAVFLSQTSPAFRALDADELVRLYESGEELRLGERLRCVPVPLPHDCGATFGFRFEGPRDIFGHAERLAYATDLGSWTNELARFFANVDLLALEFNHDVELEAQSRRSPELIARVLGDEGHLSNAQAAALVNAVLGLSEPGRLRHVVQLHLSGDCNRPQLAAMAARAVVAEWDVSIAVHTARQDRPGPRLALGASWPVRRRVRRVRRRSPVLSYQPLLPGWE
jgi:phosphoribosyl 1,2-cyclic phosphodiesterase